MRALAKNALLGQSIGVERSVPVKMILRQIQQGCRIGLQGRCDGQLKAGQLKHPDGWQLTSIHRLHECIEHGWADIAGRTGRLPCNSEQVGCHGGRGGFAIGARNGDKLGGVARITPASRALR
jgi:hypothetical protein